MGDVRTRWQLAASSIITMMLLAWPGSAQAEELWLTGIDAGLGRAFTSPQSSQFGPGLSGSFVFYRSLHPRVLVGGRARAGFLAGGDPPRNSSFEDTGVGTFALAMAEARVRIFGDIEGDSRGLGLYATAAFGGGITGDQGVPAFEIGAGWNSPLASIDLGVAIRYTHMIYRGDVLDSNDAGVMFLYGEVLFGDRRTPEVVEDRDAEIAGRDSDGDGILNADDACTYSREDIDGYEDEDGCPDRDNDQDGIEDIDEMCPMEPEDFDGFEDDDGCPEPDNDGDGFADGDDACIDEPEVFNGIDDGDGCPDEGEIVLEGDRVVLPTSLLFESWRLDISGAAEPSIAAIVTMWQQHADEWTEVRIEGHTHVEGNPEESLQLSQRWANAVRNALVAAGMPAEVIVAVGYGESRPLDVSGARESRDTNRRVEVVIVARSEPAEGASASPSPSEEGEGE